MFSIIIPVYNKANTIKKSIESVINQTFKEFELIIVNDGSTDEIENIIKEFSNIIYIQKPNGGVSAARNTGIIKSKYDYICFLDADDTWEPNHLDVMAHLVRQYQNYGMYCTSFKTIFENGKEIFSNENLYDIKSDSFEIQDFFKFSNKRLKNTFIHTNSICINKSVFTTTGVFEEGISSGEDTDLWLRIALYFPVVLSKKCTSNYQREYSTLTRFDNYNYNWIFFKRKKILINDNRIPFEKKISLMKYYDNYVIGKIRHKLLEGKKKDAISLFNEIENPSKHIKRMLITIICIFVPSKLLNKSYNNLSIKYFSEK